MANILTYLCSKDEFDQISISFPKGSRVYLKGDLGAGKTTLVRYFLKKYFHIQESVRSPTYIYFNEYEKRIFHFDLYRMEDYDAFVNIGGEEIFESSESTIFCEWPELIEDIYPPTHSIQLSLLDDMSEKRRIDILHQKHEDVSEKP